MIRVINEIDRLIEVGPFPDGGVLLNVGDGLSEATIHLSEHEVVGLIRVLSAYTGNWDWG